MPLNIRPETSGDIEAIDEVTIAAFLNARHTDHTEQHIVQALRNSGLLSISLVAELDDQAVGHVAVSPVSISDGSMGWMGLGPISVRPEFQGQGIGSLLMREALHRLVESGAAGCVVLGEPAYYHRFGFSPAPSLVLQDVPPEYFQALVFQGAFPSGIVTYHSAFNARG